jgi:hypothetical protein
MATEVTDMRNIILATLAEIEEDIEHNKEEIVELKPLEKNTKVVIEETKSITTAKLTPVEDNKEQVEDKNLSKILHKLEENIDDEGGFLLGMRERLLVLFEGLRASKNQRLEKKLNLTISYLEYTLAIIDERLENKQS